MEIRFAPSSSFLKIALVFSLNALVGCFAHRTPPSRNPQIHTIRYSGETISAISKWYTGSERNWSRVLEANPGMSSETLQIGSKLVIPGALVVRRDAPPRSVLVTKTARPKPTPDEPSPDVLASDGHTSENGSRDNVNDNNSNDYFHELRIPD